MSSKDKRSSRHKVVFSKEIDDKLSGIALGFAFVAIGLLLLLCPNYFGDEKVRSYFVWSFIVVGSIGLFVEADKGKTIHGFTNIAMGAILLLIWFLLYQCGATINFILALISLLLLLIGVYATILGIIQVGYSIRVNILATKEGSGESRWSDLILFLTKIASLILILLQIIRVLLG